MSRRHLLLGPLDLFQNLPLLLLLLLNVSPDHLILLLQPTFWGFFHLALTSPFQALDELREGGPLVGFHVDVVTVVNLLIVDDRSSEAVKAVAPLHVLEKGRLELLGVGRRPPSPSGAGGSRPCTGI